jgi:hypothetical protein
MRPLPCLALLLPLLVPGCGGGGGAVAPAGAAARLVAAATEIPAGVDAGWLEFTLADLPAAAPTLLQITLVLPAALTVAAAEPLQPLQAVPTLRGASAGGAYRVVCGDDQNVAGQPLAAGALFRVRLAAAAPRQPGDHIVHLTDLVAATADGPAAAVTAVPSQVTIAIR